MKALAWAALALGVAACKYPELPQLSGDAQHADTGGSDGQETDAPPGTVDAAPDGPSHTCYVPMDLGGLTLGMAASPTMSNWFSVPTSGPNAGKTVFTLAAQVNPQAPITVLAIDVARPAAGFATNTAYAFTATPNTAFVAQSYVFGDYNTTTNTYQQLLFSSNGSITFSAIGETSSSNINGTVTMTNYREIDETTNANVPGGCTSTMQSLAFFLRQM